jgi:hypothetical protein
VIVALAALCATAFAPRAIWAQEPKEVEIKGLGTLGRTLQDRYRVQLSEAAPDLGLSIQLQSVDPSSCLLSGSHETLGASTLTVWVRPRHLREYFWIQSLAGAGATCRIEATLPPGWDPVNLPYDVTIETAKLRLTSLEASQTTQEPPSPFSVAAGVGSDQGGLRRAQRLTQGTCSVQVCSDDDTVLTIVDADGIEGPCGWADLDPRRKRTRRGDLKIKADPGVTQATTVTVRATSVCFPPDAESEDLRDVTVAQDTTRLGDRKPLGEGHQDDFRVRLSHRALTPTTATVTTPVRNPEICRLSSDGTSDGTDTIQVPIEAGQHRATFFVQGVKKGTCEVTISVPSYASSTDYIEVVQPGLRIIELDRTRAQNHPDDPFRVKAGASRGPGRVPRPQVVNPGASQVDVRVTSSHPPAGQIVAGGVPGPEQTVPIPPLADRTSDEGPDALAFRPGDDTIEDAPDTTVSAESGDYEPHEVDIIIETITAELRGPDEIGNQLQQRYVLTTSQNLAYETIFDVSVGSGTYCKLWNPETEQVVTDLPVTIPANRSRAPVTVLGESEGQGRCTVSFSARAGGDQVPDDERPLWVDEGLLDIVHLGSTLSAHSDGDPFAVRALSPEGRPQRVRPDVDLQLLVCSTNPAAAMIWFDGDEYECADPIIERGKAQTKPGLIKLVPKITTEPDETTVEAQATGFVEAEQKVVVGLDVTDIRGPSQVGRDLEDLYTLRLTPRPSEPVSVRLTVEKVGLQPEYACALSASPTELGGPSLDVDVPPGTFQVQGLLAGEICRIRAEPTDPLYEPTVLDIAIVTPALRIVGLDRKTYIDATPDEFAIVTGIPTAEETGLKRIQSVNPVVGVNGLEVLGCSSDFSIGVILGGESDEDGCASAWIPVGESTTDVTTAKELALDPLGDDTVTVTAKVPDGNPPFITTDKGKVDVDIEPLAFAIEEKYNVNRVGAGLMDTFRLTTSQNLAEDRTFTLVSQTPDACRVAVDDKTPSAGWRPTPPPAGEPPSYGIFVKVLKGRKQATFELHGLEDLGDDNEGEECTLHASEPELGETTGGFQIVRPAAKLGDLKNTIKFDASDDAFKVVVGVMKKKGDDSTTLEWNQKVRIDDGVGLVVKVCSSKPQFGVMVLRSLDIEKECEEVEIEEGRDSSRLSGTNTHQYQIRHRPKSRGETWVEVQEWTDPYLYLIVTDAARELVTVTSEALAIEDGGTTSIGAGLQSGTFTLTATKVPLSPGTIDVTIASTTTGFCKVAATSSDPGQDSMVVSVPRNAAPGGYVGFWVQGLAEGDCSLQATTTADDYEPDLPAEKDLLIVEPALRIINLSSLQYLGTLDPFDVQVGISEDAQDLSVVQAVVPGDGVDVTVSSGDPSVASLETSSESGGTVTATIPGGSSSSSESGLALVPVAVGETVVSASATDFRVIGASQLGIQVMEPVGCGLGFEIAPVLALLLWAANRQQRRARVRR